MPISSTPPRVSLRFYAELNDHLPPDEQYRPIERELLLPTTVKDLIEAIGVPHTEIDLILVNGESVSFAHLIRAGDRIAVYPVFEALDISPVIRLRPQPLRDPKFVLDVHLGRLAAYLRMLGFDVLYDQGARDPDLVRIASDLHRILLTRDRGLLKHSAVTHGYWLRETDSRRQAAEVVRRFDLARLICAFSRCMVCNESLRPIAKTDVVDRIPPKVADWCSEFRACAACRRVYWEGSHWRRMQQWIAELAGPQTSPAKPE